MKDDEVKEKFELDEVGVVGKAFHVSAGEDEGKYLISFRVDDFKPAQFDEEVDEFKMVAMLSVFKHLFKSHFQLHDLEGKDFNILCEVDKRYFRKEVQTTIEEEGKPIFFALSQEEIDEKDPTKWVPEVRLSEDLEKELKEKEEENNDS